MGLCPTLRNFTGVKWIALLEFFPNLKDTFDNSGLCAGEVDLVLAYSLGESDTDLYKAYPANGMSIDGHVYHGTWLAVINALIQRFLAKYLL